MDENKSPPRWELSRVVQLPLIVTVLSLGATGIWRLAEVNGEHSAQTLKVQELETKHLALAQLVMGLTVVDASTDEKLRGIQESLRRIERWMERQDGVYGPPPNDH